MPMVGMSFESVVSTGELVPNDFAFQIYPNPANNAIHILL
jgi:hypothetical protein